MKDVQVVAVIILYNTKRARALLIERTIYTCTILVFHRLETRMYGLFFLHSFLVHIKVAQFNQFVLQSYEHENVVTSFKSNNDSFYPTSFKSLAES